MKRRILTIKNAACLDQNVSTGYRHHGIVQPFTTPLKALYSKINIINFDQYSINLSIREGK